MRPRFGMYMVGPASDAIPELALCPAKRIEAQSEQSHGSRIWLQCPCLRAFCQSRAAVPEPEHQGLESWARQRAATDALVFHVKRGARRGKREPLACSRPPKWYLGFNVSVGPLVTRDRHAALRLISR